MTPRWIIIAVGPRYRVMNWLAKREYKPGEYVVGVYQPDDVKHLQGICIDKRVKDESFIDLTEGDPEWRETLAYVDTLFA